MATASSKLSFASTGHHVHNVVHLSLCIGGGLLAFLPLLTHYEWEDIQTDATNLLELYRSSSLVAVTLLIPMALDTLLEMYFKLRTPMVAIKLPKDALSVAEKLVLLAGLAVTPFVGAFDLDSLFHVEDKLSLIYMCCRKSQNILVLGVVMTSLSRYKRNYWYGSITTVCLLGLIVGQVVSLYYNIHVFNGRESFSLYAIMLFFSLLSLSLFYGMTCRWTYCLTKAFLVKRNVLESFAGSAKADVFVDDESTKFDRRKPEC